jgi:eukaryotic translation initiation factor 2-alpha kinase 4
MEFCEKSTLRTAIDSELYQNQERVWRLFREIAEGLAHIHQQGMIHRDLKPVNIFLDSRDQVKIGDFGLATTGHLALQSQDNNVTVAPAELGTSSQTGKVGTALYVAPELVESASKSTYNQKVDLYSLGIIMFEMSSPPPNTAMERVSKILALRTPKITFPGDFLTPKYSQQAQVIRWLLNHDPSQRPTSEELLLSELVPPAKLEAYELEDMIRHVLANPQTRTYKHLVARCLTQESSPVCELTYHMGMLPILSSFEFVKTKVMSLFHKHGAIEVEAPLLTPYLISNSNVVKLMTHSGSVVTLPHDLRLPFVRHAAINGINNIRRYSISRVYREKKVFNFHPKQLYEIVFDVITPNRGNLLIDAELLAIAHELVHNELPALTNQNQNIRFRINHTSLLRAILMYCNVAKDKWKDLLSLVSDFMENKISKFQLTASINNTFLQNTKHNTTTLLEFLQTDTPITNINLSPLRILIRGRGEAASLAQTAIRELETVIQLMQGMLATSTTCQIHIVCGLAIGFERAKTGGIVWQMVGNLKPDRQSDNVTTIAIGGRYDSLLTDIQ